MKEGEVEGQDVRQGKGDVQPAGLYVLARDDCACP